MDREGKRVQEVLKNWLSASLRAFAFTLVLEKWHDLDLKMGLREPYFVNCIQHFDTLILKFASVMAVLKLSAITTSLSVDCVFKKWITHRAVC